MVLLLLSLLEEEEEEEEEEMPEGEGLKETGAHLRMEIEEWRTAVVCIDTHYSLIAVLMTKVIIPPLPA
jgi:hypothetical protein